MSFNDEDIDLRPYIYAIFRQWWKILIFALLSAVVAVLITLSTPRQYQATATILVTRSRANLSLAEQFPTVNDPVDATSRINAMLSIAQSDSLIQQVTRTVDSSLTAQDKSIVQFRKFVKIMNNGDLISIVAIAKNPLLAMEIANTWAKQAVVMINQAYSDEQPVAEVQKQIKTTQDQYNVAQTALVSFTQGNQISFLEKQISEAESLLSNLSNDRTWQISYYEQRKQDMQNLIVQAESLKSQIESGNSSVAGNLGDALAVLFARASQFGVSQRISQNTNSDTKSDSTSMEVNNPNYSTQGPSITIQITDLNALKDTSQNYAADLSTLIKRANDEKAAVEKTLENLSQSVNKGEGYDSMQTAAQNLQQLKAKLESEEARQRELTSDRDLAWKAYQAMLQKETELQSTPQANEVVLAVPAIESQTPAPRNTLRNSGIAAFLGLFAGVAFVLFMEWWSSADIKQKTSEQKQALETRLQ